MKLHFRKDFESKRNYLLYLPFYSLSRKPSNHRTDDNSPAILGKNKIYLVYYQKHGSSYFNVKD